MTRTPTRSVELLIRYVVVVGWVVLLLQFALVSTALAEPSSAEDAANVSTATEDGLSAARTRARELFIAASSRAVRGEWLEAARLYKLSYALDRHASTLLNVGVCYERLGRPAFALSYVLRALASPADEQLREADLLKARALELRLLESLGSVRLGNPRDAWSDVDVLDLQVKGYTLRMARLSDQQAVILSVEEEGGSSIRWSGEGLVLLEPGRHELTLAAGGHRVTSLVDVHRGQASTLAWSAKAATVHPDIDVQTPVAKPRSEHEDSSSQVEAGSSAARYGSYAAMAVSAMGAGLGLRYGLEARRLETELARACDAQGRCPVARQGDVEEYRSAARLSNAGVAIGVGGLALAITLLLVAEVGDPPLAVSHRDIQLQFAF